MKGADLLPHGPAAVLLEAVLERRPAGVVCAGRIPAGHPLVRDGLAPSFAVLELAAQAAAAFEMLTAADAARRGRPRRGFLVSARDVVFDRPGIPAGVALHVSVDAAGHAGSLSLYHLEVSVDGACCARGTIGTFVDAAAGVGEGR